MASQTASGSGVVSEAEVTFFQNRLTSMTVVELKGVIRDFGSRCGARLAISGTKMTIINRLKEQLDSWRHNMRWSNLREAMRIIEAPRDGKGAMLVTSSDASAGTSAAGAASTSAPSHWAAGVSGYGAASSSAHGVRPPPTSMPGYRGSMPGAGGATIGGTPTNKIPGRHPGTSSGYVGQPGSSSAVRTAAYVPSRLNFKSSPFWRIQEFVSPTVILQEAAIQNRKTSNIDLRLNPQQLSLIKAPSSNYQVRLFCTTKAAAEIAERSPNHPAHIEFPMSCELRINGNLYSASLKGSKKQPGRVPPPNLNKDKSLMTRDGMVNKVELVYTNILQKHVMVVALCVYTPVEAIVAKLQQEKRKSREEIVGTMKKAAAEDDIEVGTSTLSLRDPLSYTRIQAPCRSIHCSHVQCFDASFFFMSNEQSPNWTCPHCSKTLRPEDLFIDGYFDDMLKRVPEDEDAVEVDPDGSWRTRDGKVTSSSKAIPTAANGSLADGQSAPKVESPAPTTGVVTKQEQDTSSSGLPPPSNGIPAGAEIVTLDDSPSPPPASARPPASASTSANGQSASTPMYVDMSSNSPAAQAMPSASTTASRSTPLSTRGRSAHEAIDLTLSDSDDDTAPPPPRRPPTQAPSATAPSRQGPSSGSNLSGAFGMPPPAVQSAMSPGSGSLHPTHSQPEVRPATVSPVTGPGFSQWANHNSSSSTSRPSFPPPPPFNGHSSQEASLRAFDRLFPMPPTWSHARPPPLSTASSSSSGGPSSSSSAAAAAAPASAPPVAASESSFRERLADFRQASRSSQEPVTPLWPPASARAAPSSSSSNSNSTFVTAPGSSQPAPTAAGGTATAVSASGLTRARDSEEDDSADASGTTAPASKRPRRGDSTDDQQAGAVANGSSSSAQPILNGGANTSGGAGPSSHTSTPLPSVSPSPPPTGSQRRQPRRSGAPINYDERDDDDDSGGGGRSAEDEEDDEPVRGPGRLRTTTGTGAGAAPSTSTVFRGASVAATTGNNGNGQRRNDSGDDSGGGDDDEFGELSDSAFDQVQGA